MTQGTRKKTKKPLVVKKPYLTGSVTDSTTVKGALGFFGVTVIMTVMFLIAGAILMFDHQLLRIVVNAAVMGIAYAMFYYYGVNSGTLAVNQGEIMYNRRETGREVGEGELSRCYHPAKGFVVALLGTLPLFVCAVILACTAQRQASTIGVMPSWMSGLMERSEVGAPLAFYREMTPVTIETVMRLIVRMYIMPVVNIFGSGNMDAMLLLERLSPIFALLPAIAYGLGYTGGVRARTMIHSQIERSRRRKKRKTQQNAAARKQRERAARDKGPGQLN